MNKKDLQITIGACHFCIDEDRLIDKIEQILKKEGLLQFKNNILNNNYNDRFHELWKQHHVPIIIITGTAICYKHLIELGELLK